MNFISGLRVYSIFTHIYLIPSDVESTFGFPTEIIFFFEDFTCRSRVWQTRWKIVQQEFVVPFANVFFKLISNEKKSPCENWFATLCWTHPQMSRFESMIRKWSTATVNYGCPQKSLDLTGFIWRIPVAIKIDQVIFFPSYVFQVEITQLHFISNHFRMIDWAIREFNMLSVRRKTAPNLTAQSDTDDSISIRESFFSIGLFKNTG